MRQQKPRKNILDFSFSTFPSLNRRFIYVRLQTSLSLSYNTVKIRDERFRRDIVLRSVEEVRPNCKRDLLKVSLGDTWTLLQSGMSLCLSLSVGYGGFPPFQIDVGFGSPSVTVHFFFLPTLRLRNLICLLCHETKSVGLKHSIKYYCYWIGSCP